MGKLVDSLKVFFGKGKNSDSLPEVTEELAQNVYEKAMEDYKAVMERQASNIEKQLENFEKLANDLKKMDDSPGMKKASEFAREGVKSLLSELEKERRAKAKEAFLEKNPEFKRLEKLLKVEKSREFYEGIGVKPIEYYEGSEQYILDQYNYKNLNNRYRNDEAKKIFLPYLSLLEKAGGYDVQELPAGVRKLYENHVKEDMNWGMSWCLYMGIFDIDIIDKCFKDNFEMKTMLILINGNYLRQVFGVDKIIKDKVPAELRRFIKEPRKKFVPSATVDHAAALKSAETKEEDIPFLGMDFDHEGMHLDE